MARLPPSDSAAARGDYTAICDLYGAGRDCNCAHRKGGGRNWASQGNELQVRALQQDHAALSANNPGLAKRQLGILLRSLLWSLDTTKRGSAK